jgi:hypothetical protein
MEIDITLCGAAWTNVHKLHFLEPLKNLPYLYDWEDTSFRLFYH